MSPALSARSEDVTNDPCIALKNAATTGAEKATNIHGLIPNLKLNSHSLPIQQATPSMK